MQNNAILSTKEKRTLLKGLSAPFVLLKKGGEIDTVNEELIKLYTNETHQNFKSYRGWLSLGYQVKKHEKAFLIWGTPQKYKKGTPPPEPTPKENTEDKEDKFFPLAYIFSNAQVEKIGGSND